MTGFSRAVRTTIALTSEPFRRQVLGNVCNHAYFLLRAPVGKPAKDLAYASEVIQQPTAYLDRFALAVIHDTAFDATDNETTITDEQVDTAIATVWPWFAAMVKTP